MSTWPHGEPELCLLQAVTYYAQARNSAALVSVLYRLEDYRGLEQLAAAVPEGSPLLPDAGARFQSVGLCEQGVAAFVKVACHRHSPCPSAAGKPCQGAPAPCGGQTAAGRLCDVPLAAATSRWQCTGQAWSEPLPRWLCLQAGELQRAVDCCVHLNHWDQAVDLARQHSLPQIETLLAQYAGRLLEDKRTLEAVQLYRKASDQLHSPSCGAAAAAAQEGCPGAGGALSAWRNTAGGVLQRDHSDACDLPPAGGWLQRSGCRECMATTGVPQGTRRCACAGPPADVVWWGLPSWVLQWHRSAWRQHAGSGACLAARWLHASKLLSCMPPVQSNHHIEAAKLLAQLAAEAAAARAPPLRVKKLHVLAALEVERFRSGLLDAGKLCCTH